MVANLHIYNEVLKVNLFNLSKLIIISYFVFCLLPRYIFPQKHIQNSLDRLVYNIVYMVAAVLLIVPLLVFLKVFSFITMVFAFFILKGILYYIFEKKNIITEFRKNYHPFIINILNKLDSFYLYFLNKRIKDFKSFVKVGKIRYKKILFYCLVVFFVFYIIADINLINLLSLNNKTSDVSQFIEWVSNLNKNILYADHKTGGADFFGEAIFVFFLQTITNIDSVVLFSLYPTLLFLWIMIGIYYVIYKVTDSKYSAFFAVSVYGLYALSPVATYLIGYLMHTSNPPILDIFGFKIYFTTYDAVRIKKDLEALASYPYMRLNSGLAYELSYSFFFLNLYFLTMSFLKKTTKYLVLYSLSLFCVFTFHGGAAFYLVVASSLIFINTIFFGKLNLQIMKKGAIAILFPAILGNLWILSWLKYGVPQDFGAAAPFLDKLFATKNAVKELSTGAEIVNLVVFFPVQIGVYCVMLLTYPFSVLYMDNKRFLSSSLALSIVAVIFMYVEQNLGFPTIVSQTRCASYVLLVTGFASGYYFHFIEIFIKKISKKLFDYVMLFILYLFIVCSVILTPTYNEGKYFFKNTTSIQYNSIAYNLYRIKSLREPLTYTVVGFVQSFSKVRDKGYHINVGEFLQKYNPYAPVLKIDSKYVYIIVETIPNQYKGLGEWYYRWRYDLESNLATWVSIYSKFHDNIRVFASEKNVTVYEIDNREYVKYLNKLKREKRLRNFKESFKKK